MTDVQIVQVKLTVDQASLLTAICHYAIESADEETNPDTVEELKRLATFFAAVTLEPWLFKGGEPLPLST